MINAFLTSPQGPVVRAIITPDGKKVVTEPRPPKPDDIKEHLYAQKALGVIVDKAISLDLDHHTPDLIGPLLAVLRALGIPAYFGPGTTRGSRIWLFTEPGDLEPKAGALSRLAKALGYTPCEHYPNGDKPVILPLFGAATANGQRRPLFGPDGAEVQVHDFNPQRVSLEVLEKARRAIDLFLVALQRKPELRHDTAMAFLNLAHRLGVLEEATVLMGTEALYKAWELDDGTRTLESWREEVQRLKEAAQDPGYAAKRGIPFLKDAGYELPQSVLEALPIHEVYPEPLPLYRSPEDPKPFPMEALGPLEGVVREVIRIVQAPEALVAASFLAAAAYAAQGVADVEVDGRKHPLSLYLLTIAESGERKTAVDLVATHPIREWQKTLQGKLREARVAYQAELDTWEAQRKAILSNKDLSPEERVEALKTLGPKPTPPWNGIVLTTEPTVEGLTRLLATGWPSIGLFVNEGGVFLGGYAMSKDHRLRAIATLSTLWDGQPLDRVRVGDGATLLYGRRLAAHIMAQPEVAKGLLNDPLAQEQGILARFLLAHPKSTAGTRRYVAEDPKETPAFRRYQEVVEVLLGMVEDTVKGQEDKELGLEPRTLTLTPEAKELWVDFHNHIEAQLADPDLYPVKALAAKVPEHALRLAGVLTLLTNPGADRIGPQEAIWGATLAEYYLMEALRLAGSYRVPPDLLLAEEVVAWLKRYLEAVGRRVFHLAEVYQYGPPGVRNAQKAREALRTLESHGYIFPKPGVEIDGRIRREAWEVHPNAL